MLINRSFDLQATAVVAWSSSFGFINLSLTLPGNKPRIDTSQHRPHVCWIFLAFAGIAFSLSRALFVLLDGRVDLMNFLLNCLHNPTATDLREVLNALDTTLSDLTNFTNFPFVYIIHQNQGKKCSWLCHFLSFEASRPNKKSPKEGLAFVTEAVRNGSHYSLRPRLSNFL